MTRYLRPIIETVGPRPGPDARRLAGGWCWFSEVDALERGAPARRLPLSALSEAELARLCAPRAPICGLEFERPNIMGILNVTPDSFSDGGLFDETGAAVDHALTLSADGADMLDIGGESTRPGAMDVPVEVEIGRTQPVIAALRAQGVARPMSIDTRKSLVAQAALDAGAGFVNDVSALTYDPLMAGVVALHGAPVCLMHAQGTPQTMQDDPQYGDVLLDIYDDLAARIDTAQAAGIERAQIVIDPGIGFGKTLDQNLTLLRNVALFHALGCVLLLGVSRKRFIGQLCGSDAPDQRVAGSVALAVELARQGVQLVRVHDVKETRQALDVVWPLWSRADER